MQLYSVALAAAVSLATGPRAAQAAEPDSDIYSALIPTAATSDGERWTAGDQVFVAALDGRLITRSYIEQVARNPRVCELVISGDLPGTSTVPEPIGVVLLGTGLAGLALVRRRRGGQDRLSLAGPTLG